MIVRSQIPSFRALKMETFRSLKSLGIWEWFGQRVRRRPWSWVENWAQLRFPVGSGTWAGDAVQRSIPTREHVGEHGSHVNREAWFFWIDMASSRLDKDELWSASVWSSPRQTGVSRAVQPMNQMDARGIAPSSIPFATSLRPTLCTQDSTTTTTTTTTRTTRRRRRTTTTTTTTTRTTTRRTRTTTRTTTFNFPGDAVPGSNEVPSPTGAEVFYHFTKEQYKEVRKNCIESILHTDMMAHQAGLNSLISCWSCRKHPEILFLVFVSSRFKGLDVTCGFSWGDGEGFADSLPDEHRGELFFFDMKNHTSAYNAPSTHGISMDEWYVFIHHSRI